MKQIESQMYQNYGSYATEVSAIVYEMIQKGEIPASQYNRAMMEVNRLISLGAKKTMPESRKRLNR